jgi:FtsP/CotA-like multicopper oxidase with cupredoxin domain
VELFAAIRLGESRARTRLRSGLPDGGRPRPRRGQLMYEGTAHFFCTLACAGHFASDPERYTHCRGVPRNRCGANRVGTRTASLSHRRLPIRFRSSFSTSEEEAMSASDVKQFPAETEHLPVAGRPVLVALADGDSYDLRIAPVKKRIGDTDVRMLAYNGSVPGPTLKVTEGSHVIVNVENHGDLEATVHWHGLRLDYRYDGTHETQKPIGVGERFEYRLEFPDPGAYWYHPHIRQDYGQEMGLYGNIIVVPADPEYWPPAHRELPLTLDDVLLE